MELPLDTLFVVYEFAQDPCLFLTCRYLYARCPDKKYWIVPNSVLSNGEALLDLAGIPHKISTKLARRENIRTIRLAVQSKSGDQREYHIRHILEVSCSEGYLYMVMILVDCGVDLTACNYLALQLASAHGHLNIVEYLLSRGVDITARSDIALRMAVSCGHLEVVKFLRSNGANLSEGFFNALALAQIRGHHDVFKHFEKHII